MGYRKSFVRFDKILVGVLSLLFGIVGLVFIYQAVKTSTEQRSKAAEARTIYKQWEFNGENTEGWTAVLPGTATIKNGALIVSMVKGTALPAFRNSSVKTSIPKGLKTVSISMAVGAVQAPTITKGPIPTPTAAPTRSGGGFGTFVKGVSSETDDAAYQRGVTEGTVCTMDVKICPDGSAVGRSGPNCEFIPCPTSPPSPEKRKFTAFLYYQLAGKDRFEKPVKFAGVVDGKFQSHAITLPDIAPIDIKAIRIVFTSGAKKGESVSVDWIRLRGPRVTPTTTPTFTPTPSIVCKTGVNSFSVDTECSGGFRYMTFKCYDGFGRREGGPTSCKSSEVWSSYAKEYCAGHSNCSVTVTPPPPSRTPQPTTSIPTSFPTPVAVGCGDSDGRDYYKKGTLTYTNNPYGVLEEVDSCADAKTVIEGVCNSPTEYTKNHEQYACEHGCFNGLCNTMTTTQQ